MGITGENVAEKHSITREEQDAYALASHRKASAGVEGRAVRCGGCAGERAGEEGSGDGGVRAMRVCGMMLRSRRWLALKPAFKKDGTVTAGNAPGVNDAAAAVVVMSAEKAKELGLKALVTIKAQATSGVAPKWVMLAPVTGVQKVLKRAGWTAG